MICVFTEEPLPPQKNGAPSKKNVGPPPIERKKMWTKKTKQKNGIGTSIRIGQEILCLPFAGFFSSLN